MTALTPLVPPTLAERVFTVGVLSAALLVILAVAIFIVPDLVRELVREAKTWLRRNETPARPAVDDPPAAGAVSLDPRISGRWVATPAPSLRGPASKGFGGRGHARGEDVSERRRAELYAVVVAGGPPRQGLR